MVRPVEVESRPNFWLKLRYSSGANGEVDLSHLVELGVFKAWNDESFFESANRALRCGRMGK